MTKFISSVRLAATIGFTSLLPFENYDKYSKKIYVQINEFLNINHHNRLFLLRSNGGWPPLIKLFTNLHCITSGIITVQYIQYYLFSGPVAGSGGDPRSGLLALDADLGIIVWHGKQTIYLIS